MTSMSDIRIRTI